MRSARGAVPRSGSAGRHCSRTSHRRHVVQQAGADDHFPELRAALLTEQMSLVEAVQDGRGAHISTLHPAQQAQPRWQLCFQSCDSTVQTAAHALPQEALAAAAATAAAEAAAQKPKPDPRATARVRMRQLDAERRKQAALEEAGWEAARQRERKQQLVQQVSLGTLLRCQSCKSFQCSEVSSAPVRAGRADAANTAVANQTPHAWLGKRKDCSCNVSEAMHTLVAL